MALKSGHVSISLARRIIPDAFTVEHYPLNQLLDTSNIPRDVEIWGFVDNHTHTSTTPFNLNVSTGFDIGLGPANRQRTRDDVHLEQQYILLAKMTLDVSKLSYAQSIPVSNGILRGGISIRAILVRVVNNWSQPTRPDSTACLYRVLAHGKVDERVESAY